MRAPPSDEACLSSVNPPKPQTPDMPRATFFRCKSAVDEEGRILLFTPLKWKRDGWIAKWCQVRASRSSGRIPACTRATAEVGLPEPNIFRGRLHLRHCRLVQLSCAGTCAARVACPAEPSCSPTVASASCAAPLQEEDGSIHLLARSRKPVAPAPICGFELSRSGELLAAVTPDGEALPAERAALCLLAVCSWVLKLTSRAGDDDGIGTNSRAPLGLHTPCTSEVTQRSPQCLTRVWPRQSMPRPPQATRSPSMPRHCAFSSTSGGRT